MKLIRTKGRGARQTAELLAALEDRGGAALDAVMPAVRRIVKDVRKQSDRALLRYAAQFDGLADAANLRITTDEMATAWDAITPAMRHALTIAGVIASPCGGHLVRCDAQNGYVCEAVEFGGVAEQSAVTLLAHIVHDTFDGGQHGIERRAAAIFERGEHFCFCCAPRPFVRMSFIVFSGLEHDLVERILDDAGCLGCLEPGNHIAGDALFNDGVDRDPVGVAELGDGGRIERGQHGEDGFKIVALDVEHEADLRLRIDGAAQHERDLIDLLALPRVGEGFLPAIRCVSLSMMVSMILRWLALSELPVSVTSTMASASVGGLTSVAPQLNSTLTLTPLAAK